jgi:hypothetical protein
MFSNPFCQRSQPLALTSLLPQGAGRGDLPRIPSTGRPVPQALCVQGERPRTHSSKKKIMKTQTHKDSELQNRTAQRNVEKLPQIDFARRNRNRGLQTELLLNVIRREAPEFWDLAQVVGKWVWIQFDGKQPRQITATLAELGFHWNYRRQVWQHPCGTIAPISDQDPRRKYRSYFPADINPA